MYPIQKSIDKLENSISTIKKNIIINTKYYYKDLQIKSDIDLANVIIDSKKYYYESENIFMLI